MGTMFVPQDTKCNDCIFLDNHDCRLNKISFYRSKNITIEEGPILKKFTCPYFRPQTWLTDKEHCKNLISEIRKENKLPYIAIILHLGDDIVIKTIQKILTFSTKPKEIYIIKKNTDKLEIVNEINKLLDGTGILWKVEFEFEDNAWHNIFKDYRRKEFMLLIRAYPKVRSDWPHIIETKVQDELTQFSYAENKSQTIMLISPYVYNMYYFDYGKNFLIRLRQQRHHQKCIL